MKKDVAVFLQIGGKLLDCRFADGIRHLHIYFRAVHPVTRLFGQEKTVRAHFRAALRAKVRRHFIREFVGIGVKKRMLARGTAVVRRERIQPMDAEQVGEKPKSHRRAVKCCRVPVHLTKLCNVPPNEIGSGKRRAARQRKLVFKSFRKRRRWIFPVKLPQSMAGGGFQLPIGIFHIRQGFFLRERADIIRNHVRELSGICYNSLISLFGGKTAKRFKHFFRRAQMQVIPDGRHLLIFQIIDGVCSLRVQAVRIFGIPDRDHRLVHLFGKPDHPAIDMGNFRRS